MTKLVEFWHENKLRCEKILERYKPTINNPWHSLVRTVIRDKSKLLYDRPTDINAVSNKNVLWTILGNLPCSLTKTNATERSITPIKPDKEQNALWKNYEYTSLRKNASRYKKAELPAYIDFSQIKHGFDLYEAAHVLTHLWADPVAVRYKVKNKPYIYKKYFDIAVASILLNKVYDVPIYVGPGSSDPNWVLPSAIKMGYCIHRGHGEPSFLLSKYDLLNQGNFDKILSYGFFIVYPQPQPTDYDIKYNHETILFSLGPMQVLFIGWELIDFIYTSTLTTYGAKNTPAIGVAPEDTYSPEKLIPYLELFTKLQGDNWMDLDTWMQSSQYIAAFNSTPPLPCRLCQTISKKVETVSMLLGPNKVKDLAAYATKMFKCVRSKIINEFVDLEIGLTKKVIYHERANRTRRWRNKIKQLTEEYKYNKKHNLWTLY